MHLRPARTDASFDHSRLDELRCSTPRPSIAACMARTACRFVNEAVKGSNRAFSYTRAAMCGINAIYAYRESAPSVDSQELLASRECMQARGPDAGDAWFSPDGRVGLGHRRLAIIDLSPGGAQPMRRGELVIVFNGEIYNYQELRAGLIARGRVLTSHSDTEVVLHLYD